MTAAEMDIVIGAEVSGAVNGLKQVNSQLVNTEKTAEKFTNKSKTNFTGLNRVIQDLPFGFVAISNNLEQLLPAAGALGTAFSAIIATVTFLSIGFRNWTGSIKENKEALAENAEASKKIQDSAGKEIGNLVVLTNAAKDNALSMTVRLNAVKQLQDTYPQTFANLTKEQILQGDVTKAINETTKALFAQAVVREKTSDLGPLAAQIFDLRQQREELEKQEATMKRMNAIVGRTRDRKGIISSLVGAGSQDKKGLADLSQQIAEIDKQLLPLQGKFKGIAQAIIDASKQAGTGLFSDDTKTKLKKTTKEISDFFQTDTNIKDIPKRFIDAIAVETGDHLGEVQKVLDKNPLDFKFKPIELPDDTMKRLAEATAFISSAFDQIFSSLGKGGNVFEEIGNGLKGLLIDLTKTLIKAAALSLLLNALGFGSFSIGSLFGQLAGLGSLLKFATGGVVTKPTLALVGEAGPERITPLGYEGKANNVMQGEVIFQISGQSLRGILRRADQSAYNTI
jgi:hypothetical protein